MKMTLAPVATLPSSIVSPPASDGSARGLAAEIRGRWQRGEIADAAAALETFPELKSNKSIVLDLAYEEYCLRIESGSPPDPDHFCERFPSFQASIRRLVDAHRFLDENSDLLDAGRSVEWPLAGQRFRDFRLVRELGRGAFARVYLAKEETLGDRPVAVKISLRGQGEAQTLGRIRHPNIVSVHSVQADERSGLTVVCMPYLGSATLCDVLDRVTGLDVPERGQTIIEAIRTGRLEESAEQPGTPDALLVRRCYTDAVIHLGAQLADALACIHDMGICHRDLKPSNVLLSPEGRPMLLDFNLSFDERGMDNRLGGTLPYMSPEQLLAIEPESGKAAARIDGRSDIYSLGILLYELLTGIHPYGPVPLRLSAHELRRCLLERQGRRPRPLRELNSRVDPALAELIERCLAHEPNDRPQRAEELARALRRMLSPIRRMRRWTRLHPAIAAASFLAFTAVAGVAAGVAATHESRAATLFREGREAYERRDYTGAVEKLGQSLELHADAQVLLARGQAYQRLNNLDDAVTDYERSNAIVPAPDAAAAAAYVHNLRFEHQQAARLYQQVIGLGCAGPVVYNNLGASLVQMNRPTEALPYLDWAIQHSPGLQAAYYNRALADYNRRLSYPYPISPSTQISVCLTASTGPFGAVAALLVGKTENIPHDGIRDMDTAIAIHPAVAELHYWKAEMCRFAALRDPCYFEPMCQAMEAAIELGQPASTFRDGSYATNVRFQKAKSAKPVRAGAAEHIERIVEPTVGLVARARPALPAE
jgi:serine/threonine protein kinase